MSNIVGRSMLPAGNQAGFSPLLGAPLLSLCARVALGKGSAALCGRFEFMSNHSVRGGRTYSRYKARTYSRDKAGGRVLSAFWRSLAVVVPPARLRCTLAARWAG